MATFGGVLRSKRMAARILPPGGAPGNCRPVGRSGWWTGCGKACIGRRVEPWREPSRTLAGALRSRCKWTGAAAISGALLPPYDELEAPVRGCRTAAGRVATRGPLGECHNHVFDLRHCRPGHPRDQRNTAVGDHAGRARHRRSGHRQPRFPRHRLCARQEVRHQDPARGVDQGSQRRQRFGRGLFHPQEPVARGSTSSSPRSRP